MSGQRLQSREGIRILGVDCESPREEGQGLDAQRPGEFGNQQFGDGADQKPRSATSLSRLESFDRDRQREGGMKAGHGARGSPGSGECDSTDS